MESKCKNCETLKKQIDYLRSDKYLKQVIFERNMLQSYYDNYSSKLQQIREFCDHRKSKYGVLLTDYNLCKDILSILNSGGIK
ncbi:MAG: hypothetical protein RBR93_12670 [Aliarcobacter butzleri]|nr:hypothetical protein [Aliarcobacter butzleri]